MTSTPPRRRWWRISLIMLGSLVLLLGVAYVALVRAFPPTRLAALLAEQVQAATGREFRIGGGLSLQLLPTIAVVARDVSLGNAPWGTRPELATVKRAAFELAVAPLLHGQLHVLSIDVDGADVLLETNEKGNPNWIFNEGAQRKEPSPGDASKTPSLVRLDQLTLSDARIAFRVGLTKVTHAIEIESLQLVSEGERIGVAARFAGQYRAWRLDATTGRYEALLQGQTDWPFEVQMATDGAKLAAGGSLDTRGTLRAKVSAQIDNAATLTPLLGDRVALPMPIAASAAVQRTASAVVADALRLTVGGQSLSGKVTVHTRPAGPSLEMDLAAATLDLSRWGMKPAANAPAHTSTSHEPLFGNAPLPAVSLPETPIRARLQVEQLIAPGLPQLSAVKGQLQIERDRLVAEPLSFGLAGGTVRGRFELVAGRGAPLRVRWRGDANALSIEALAAMRGAGTPVRGGRANLQANLEASGRSPRELAASLNGSALLSANDTALTGGAAMMDRNLLVTLLQALLPRQEAAQTLKIDCAVVNLPLHEGVARIDRSIAMETDKVAVAASGELNFAAQTVMLNFQPIVKKGLGLDSANLAKLVMLEGPLHDPQVRIDMKGTAREAASLGAAVATGGLTLVGKRLVSRPEDTQACKRAMGAAH